MLKDKKFDEENNSSRRLPLGFQKNFLEPISKSTNQSRLEKRIDNSISQEIEQPLINQMYLFRQAHNILKDKKLNKSSRLIKPCMMKYKFEYQQAEAKQSNQNEKQTLLELSKLQEQGSTLTTKIEQQSLLKRELQKQIELAQNCIEQKKQSLNSESGTELPHLIKLMKNQENQLEKRRRQHNEALSEILQLKDQVSVARRERVIFDQVFKKLEMDLNKTNEEIKEQIFHSIQTEKQKEQVKEELYKLKQLAHKEVNFFSAKYEDAFKLIEEEKSRIIDFDESKDNCFESTTKNNSPGSRTTKNKKKLQQEQQISEEQLKIAESAKEFEQQKLILQKIIVEANAQNIDDFIQMYNSLDAENAATIQIAAQKLEELEQLQQENDQLDKESLKQSSIDSGQQSNDNPKQFTNLQEQLIELETKNCLESENNENLSSEINYLIENFHPLLNAIKCSEDKILEIDQNKVKQFEQYNFKKQITPYNLLNFLEIIEQKTSEIIDLTNYFQDNINNKKFHYQLPEEKEQKYSLKDKQNMKAVSNLLENVEKSDEYDKLKTDDDFRVEGQQKIKEFLDQQVSSQQHSSLKIRQTRSKTKIMTLNSIHPNAN